MIQSIFAVFKERKKQNINGVVKKKNKRIMELIDQTADVIIESNQMANSVMDILREVDETTRKQTASINELTETTRLFADRSEENSLNISNLSDIVANSSLKCEDANKQTIHMIEIAQQGKQSMKNISKNVNTVIQSITSLSDTVSEAGSSAAEIKSIIKMIDEIASQTNLLALNASIEAAKAGEHGRGFAVVAAEIRKLSESVTGATKTITDLIINVERVVNQAVTQTQRNKDSIHLVQKSVEDTDAVFGSMLDVVNVIQQAVEHVAKDMTSATQFAQEISGATEEQLAVSKEIFTSTELVQDPTAITMKNNKKLLNSVEQLLKMINQSGRRIILDTGKNGDVGYFAYRQNKVAVFEYVTDSIKDILGYAPEEFMQNHTIFMTDNAINKEAEHYTNLSMLGIQQPKYLAEVRTKDGGKQLLEVTEIAVFNDRGEVIGVEGLIKALKS